MGVREDGLPTRLVRGFSGKIRPLQTVGGKCDTCLEDVWIDLPPSTQQQFLKTKVRHWACEKL